eukprot:m.8397 g.8397  ORF g.8397 m.8397 type:complete len:62 (-) comp6314_c0_seq1:34-219(-)
MEHATASLEAPYKFTGFAARIHLVFTQYSQRTLMCSDSSLEVRAVINRYDINSSHKIATVG